MMKTLVKWTVDNYHQMIRANILANRSCELIDGEIIALSPELPHHYATVKQTTSYLTQVLRGRADVRFNGPITLSNSEPEPDIAVVRLPESRYRLHHPYPEDIYWLIEVANTSLTYDLSTKKRIYAEAQVPEYWVVNLSNSELIVFRQPVDGDYQISMVWELPTINPVAFPEINIAVESLLMGG